VIDAEFVALFPYILIGAGIVLIVVGAYGWYCQKKKNELMKLEEKIK
jgi:hypothetical protein